MAKQRQSTSVANRRVGVCKVQSLGTGTQRVHRGYTEYRVAHIPSSSFRETLETIVYPVIMG